MITNIRAFQEVLKRNNLPTPDTYLGISELIRSLYRPDITPNPERIREVLEELTYPITIPAGNPITFKSCSEVLASDALVTFKPKQSGSGDPSPDNVRPISGWDSLHLYIDEEQSASPANTYTATFDSTVYGGSYDFVSGKATLDKKFVSIDGSNEWIEYPENSGKFYCNIITPNEAKRVISGTEYISNLYPFSGDGETPSGNVTIDKRFYGQRGFGRFWVYDSDYTNNFAGFKTMLNTTPLVIVYPLSTPTEITLTPEDIELLRGVNTIWTDGDNVTVKFQTLT